MSWVRSMSIAYLRGLKDGAMGALMDVTRAEGFDGCYLQGYWHGERKRRLEITKRYP